MRKIKTKQIYKQNEILCGCNCSMCNPYYGDFWEYFIRLNFEFDQIK